MIISHILMCISIIGCLVYRVYKTYMRNKHCTEEVEAKIIDCWYRRRKYFENKRILCEYEFNFNTYRTTVILRSTLNSIVYNKGDYITLYIDPYRPKSAIVKGIDRTSRYLTSILGAIIISALCLISFIPYAPMHDFAILDVLNAIGMYNGTDMGNVKNFYSGGGSKVPSQTVTETPSENNDTSPVQNQDNTIPDVTSGGINGIEYKLPAGLMKLNKDNCCAYVDKMTKGKNTYIYIYAKRNEQNEKQALVGLMKSFKLNKSNLYKKVNVGGLNYYIYIVQAANGRKEFVAIGATEFKKIAIRYLYSKENEKHLLEVIKSIRIIY